MAEKGINQPKGFTEALSSVRKQHEQKIAETKAEQTGRTVGAGHAYRNKRSYSYEADNYSERLHHEGDKYEDGKNSITSESASSNDAFIMSRMKRFYDQDGRYEASETEHQADVRIPNTEGHTYYKSDTLVEGTREGVSAETQATIVRRDVDGKEIYRFNSTNPEFADKIGALAAKRIVQSVKDDQLDEAA